MAVIAAGQPAPDFSLAEPRAHRSPARTCSGARALLVFYPFAFTSVCTDQLSIYNDLLGEFCAQGLTLYGVSCDARPPSRRSRRSSASKSSSSRTSSPRATPARRRRPTPGRHPAARARPDRPDGMVEWSHEAASPSDLPGANILRRPRGQGHLSGSARHRSRPSAPPITPGGQSARLVVVYADFECPFCAALELRLRELLLRAVFRHFPWRSSHPRACAAARRPRRRPRKGEFWEMHDSLFADGPARGSAPLGAGPTPRAGHRALRRRPRSEAVEQRIGCEFQRAGVRAGVAAAPSLFDGVRGVLRAPRRCRTGGVGELGLAASRIPSVQMATDAPS